jgi:hypothetical protein
MKKFTVALAAAATLFSVNIAPVAAAPWNDTGASRNGSMSELVQQTQARPGRYYARGRHMARPSRGYHRQSNRHYYNGHRGYSNYRPGYRQRNGWWFPAGAFAAGALIGGAIAAQPGSSASSGGSGHVAWCSQQYRSYRASDNTFQPYNGPRQQCVSPY